MTGTATILRADARSLPLPDASVDLVVTSPPYFALRDYRDGDGSLAGQIGAEPTPREYIAALIDCTREWMRVLKPGGSIFVNLGDKRVDKRLLYLPERYRIACTDDLGLYGRSVIIWSKPNGLPESVTDRVRRSHEDWVHLTTLPRYYSAIDEIREPHEEKWAANHRPGRRNGTAANQVADGVRTSLNGARQEPNPLGKLPGSVWTIATEPLKVPAELGIDHFAAYPTELPRRIILGWSPVGGVVLDPCAGTGTTALVAKALGRHGISGDRSADYCRLARWRTTDPGQLAKAMRVPPPAAVNREQMDLFGGAA